MATTLQHDVDATEVRQALLDARALIARPWAWFKGAFTSLRFVETKTEGTKEVDCYCALGALQKVTGVPTGACRSQGTPVYLAAMRRLEEAVWNRSCLNNVPAYNDAKGVTKKDILSLFDEAIASVKEK